jgi:hypothetical protein
MWRDQIDAFWDGRRGFAIGFFEAEEAMGTPGLRPDLTVVSAKDAAFVHGATLVDVLDADRWRCGHCVLELPQDHTFVSLRSPEGAELRFALVGANAPLHGGDLRLLLVEAGEQTAPGATPYRLASLPARGDWERLARDQIARGGAKLVWAISQRRVVERSDGAAVFVHLWPAQRAYPAYQSRIVLEPIELPRGCAPLTLKAPFAIMETWLRENGAPCPTLRVRVPNTLEQNEFMLGRSAIVLVMRQRRRLRDWNRRQRELGEPAVDPLVFDDIREATGFPLEQPDAVEADGDIVVHNLLNVIARHDATEFDGLSVTRLPDGGGPDSGVILDIHFSGATLGDDMGLVSTAADAGDFGVVPNDPGGASYARLFRFESDGLSPRRIDEDDLLLDEILRRAADEERATRGASLRAGGDRAQSVQGRRERLLASLNATLAMTGYAGRFEAARFWDIFEPMLMSSFVALAADAAPEARAVLPRLGGYDAYRCDPSLVQAAVRRELGASIDEAGFRDYRGAATSLLHRFLGACRLSGLVRADADLATQIGIWRVLGEPAIAARLARARISLSGREDIRDIARAADLLVEEAIIERAAIYCDDFDLRNEAQSLRDHLARRRNGEWTRFQDASRLAVLVEEANGYWREIEAERGGSLREARHCPRRDMRHDARAALHAKSEGLLATMKSFFRGRGSR